MYYICNFEEEHQFENLINLAGSAIWLVNIRFWILDFFLLNFKFQKNNFSFSLSKILNFSFFSLKILNFSFSIFDFCWQCNLAGGYQLPPCQSSIITITLPELTKTDQTGERIQNKWKLKQTERTKDRNKKTDENRQPDEIAAYPRNMSWAIALYSDLSFDIHTWFSYLRILLAELSIG